MKLLKTLVVVTLIATNAGSAFAFTEIKSAPESVLSAVTLDVSKGCLLITRAWDTDDSSPEIQQLSEYLKKEGFYKGNAVKKYTKAVKAAVAKFQLEKGIIKNENSEVLGVMTATTREYISKDTCTKKDIETPKTSCVYITRSLSTETQNDSRFSDDTRTLQRFLVQKGYLSSTFVTGSFGALTKEALKRFQFDNGIIASMTQEGAGELGPRSREFIQLNTCGKADVERTTDPKKTGYKVSLTTRTGVEIGENDSEIVLRAEILPQEQNAKVEKLTLNLESVDGVNPNQYIEAAELYTKGKIISRAKGANIWTDVSSSTTTKTYSVTLNGSPEFLSRGEEFDLNVRILPKASALSLTPKSFRIFVPKDGLAIQFSDANGNVKGTEEWGNENQKSTFKVGKIVTTTNTTVPSTSTSTTTTPTATTTTPVVNSVVVKTPQLNWVRPDNGGFGEDLVVRGTHFHPLNNKINLVHVRTGATTTLHGLASKDNQINFRFPGKGRDYERRNGTKVTANNTDLTGNYRVSVVSNGKESNWIFYKVNK